MLARRLTSLLLTIAAVCGTLALTAPAASAAETLSLATASGHNAGRNNLHVTAFGEPGPVTLYAKQAPNDFFQPIRRGSIGDTGEIAWNLRPVANTSLYVQRDGTSERSAATTLAVASEVALTNRRVNNTTYTFTGTIRSANPARQTVTLYRYTGGDKDVKIGTVVTDSQGRYRYTRSFTRANDGTVYATVPATLNNALAGKSVFTDVQV